MKFTSGRSSESLNGRDFARSTHPRMRQTAMGTFMDAGSSDAVLRRSSAGGSGDGGSLAAIVRLPSERARERGRCGAQPADANGHPLALRPLGDLAGAGADGSGIRSDSRPASITSIHHAVNGHRRRAAMVWPVASAAVGIGSRPAGWAARKGVHQFWARGRTHGAPAAADRQPRERASMRPVEDHAAVVEGFGVDEAGDDPLEDLRAGAVCAITAKRTRGHFPDAVEIVEQVAPVVPKPLTARSCPRVQARRDGR